MQSPPDAETRAETRADLTIRQSQLLGALYLLDAEQTNRATGDPPAPRSQSVIGRTLNMFRAFTQPRRPDKLDTTASKSAATSAATSATSSAASSPGTSTGTRPSASGTASVDLNQVIDFEDLQGPFALLYTLH